MLKFACVSLIGVSAAFTFAQAEEYDLRGPGPQKNAPYITDGKLTVTAADATMTRGKDVVKFKLTLTATLNEEVTVQEVSGREVTKFATKVNRDRVETVGLAKDAKYLETSVLEQETITGVRDGNAWKWTLASGKPTDPQTKELAERGGLETAAALYPEGKVKVGHTWTADAGSLSPILSHVLTGVKGELKRTFARVQMVDGELCVVIESAGKVTGKMKGNGDPSPAADIDLTHVAWKSPKTGLVVRESFQGKLKVKGDVKDGDAVTTLEISGPISGESTTKLVGKK